MALDGALTGDPIEPSLTPVKQEEERFTADERKLEQIAQDDKWVPLKEYFEGRIKTYEDALEEVIDQKDSLSLIGEKALVLHIVKQELKGALAKVEQTAEIVRGTKG